MKGERQAAMRERGFDQLCREGPFLEDLSTSFGKVPKSSGRVPTSS